MKNKTPLFPKSYIVKTLLSILLPALSLLLLVILLDYFDFSEGGLLIVLLLFTVGMAILGSKLMKWRAADLREQELLEKGAELPKESTPLFQALIDDYMQNNLHTLSDKLAPLGWLPDDDPLDCEGSIVIVYLKEKHDIYIEFSCEEIKIIFDEASSNIIETASLTEQQFPDVQAIYDYIVQMIRHYSV